MNEVVMALRSLMPGRGLHSSTFQHSISAFVGQGVFDRFSGGI